MEIRVNGETRSVEPGLTVRGLLARLGVPPARVVVERNGSVVPRAIHETETLEENDRVEIVRFVGGG
jgi:thiamine biosynthesis protein ThiS